MTEKSIIPIHISVSDSYEASIYAEERHRGEIFADLSGTKQSFIAGRINFKESILKEIEKRESRTDVEDQDECRKMLYVRELIKEIE